MMDLCLGNNDLLELLIVMLERDDEVVAQLKPEAHPLRPRLGAGPLRNRGGGPCCLESRNPASPSSSLTILPRAAAPTLSATARRLQAAVPRWIKWANCCPEREGYPCQAHTSLLHKSPASRNHQQPGNMDRRQATPCPKQPHLARLPCRAVDSGACTLCSHSILAIQPPPVTLLRRIWELANLNDPLVQCWPLRHTALASLREVNQAHAESNPSRSPGLARCHEVCARKKRSGLSTIPLIRVGLAAGLRSLPLLALRLCADQRPAQSAALGLGWASPTRSVELLHSGWSSMEHALASAVITTPSAPHTLEIQTPRAGFLDIGVGLGRG